MNTQKNKAISWYEGNKLSRSKTDGSSKVVVPSNVLIDMENERNCFKGSRRIQVMRCQTSCFGQVKFCDEGSLEINKVSGKKSKLKDFLMKKYIK